MLDALTISAEVLDQHRRYLDDVQRTSRGHVFQIRPNAWCTGRARGTIDICNAVAESFFSSLKKERIKKRVYRTRDLARADVFDYIEVFYNRKRRHGYLGNISPADFEAKTTGLNQMVH